MQRLRAVAAPAPSAESPSGPPASARVPSASWNVPPDVLRRYLPLVRQVVAQMARRLPANVLRDDLMAAGVFGLMDSLRRNGAECSETFEWYARTRIRGAIFDELRAQDWLPRRARTAAHLNERPDCRGAEDERHEKHHVAGHRRTNDFTIHDPLLPVVAL